jgi:hypothetical protein
MKQRMLWTIGLIVLALGALAVSAAKAQTVAPGPYYANPSWDQTLPCPTLNNCPRFIVLSNMNNQAVLDRETGLVWPQNFGSEKVDWFTAQDRCRRAFIGGRFGWRVPTIQELLSLFAEIPSTVEVPLPPGHPFGSGYSGIVWSASSSARDTNNAFSIDLLEGQVSMDHKDDSFFKTFVCVRGGSGVDPQ